MMKKVSLFAIVALGTLLLPCRLSSKVVLESVFSDNMVLQRNATVRIWGKADPQSKVSVLPSWTAETYSASVAVRYAWANNPFCNLVNAAGLPASPFRTDDWLQRAK